MLSATQYQEIAERYGTPCFLYDLEEAERQLQRVRDAVPHEVELCYAIKANSFLASFFAERLDRVEVCSPGELEICKKQGIAPEKIVFSGVNKEPVGTAAAVEYGAGILTIESLKHARLIEDAAAAKGVKVSAIVRLASGGQFGIDREAVLGLFAERERYPHIDFIGIHFFTGTQKKKKSEIEAELQRAVALAEEIKGITGAEVRHIEYGPGIGVSYYAADKDGAFDGVELLSELSDSFAAIAKDYRLTLEMGRLFAASCGSYISSVNDVKTNDGVNFCIIDGGINNINYYGQMMGMKQPPLMHLPERAGEKRVYTVCGSLCTFQDVLLRKYETLPFEVGDLLVFGTIGAYSSTEGMNLFLSRDLPKILFKDKDGIKVVRDTFHTSSLNG